MYGGLGVIIPTAHFPFSFLISSCVEASLVDHLLRQCITCQSTYVPEQRFSCHNDLSAQADLLSEGLTPHLRRALKQLQSEVHHIS